MSKSLNYVNYMKEKRYTIEDVEHFLGIPRSTYYNWEKLGKVSKPKRDLMSNYRYWTAKDLELLMLKTGRMKGGRLFKK